MLSLVVAAAIAAPAPPPLRLSVGLGATMSLKRPSLVGELLAFPFPRRAGAGLAETGAFVAIRTIVGNRQAVVGQAGFVYGRPRPSFWASFQTGLVLAVGRRPSGRIEMATPFLSTLKIGYGRLSIMIDGYISASTDVFGSDAYVLSVSVLPSGFEATE